MATFTWTGAAGDGNWDNPMNWSPNGTPGPADTVSISTSAATVINLDTGYGAGTLTTNKNVTLDLSNQSTFTLGSGSAGTFSNGGILALQSSNQNTDLIIGSARETLTGAGTITMSDNGSNRIYGASASDVLTNINNTIEGSGQLGAGQLTLTNAANGRIIATGASNALVVNTAAATVSNSGLMEATGSGGLAIESVVNNGASGKIVAAGGNVYLLGGGDLQGGTLSSSGGAAITVQGGQTGTLDGTANAVTNTGTVAVNNQGTLAVLGSIVNSGIIALQSGNQNTDLAIGPATGTPGTATLSGAGMLSLSDNGGNRIYGAQAGDTLLNASTIAGAGQLGNGTLTLINQGTIDATGTYNGLVVNTGSTVVNDALMEATNPNGGLVLQATIDDSSTGTILAAGGNVYLQGADIVGGLLNSTSAGGAITVQGGESATIDGSSGTLTNAGQFAINNQGSLTVLGTLTNTGTISLQSGNQNTEFVVASPTVTLTGGGVVSLSDNTANYIFADAASDVLDNVNNIIEGSGQIGDNTLTLLNSGTIDATGTSNALYLNGDTLITNTKLIEATGAAGMYIQNTTVDDITGGTLSAVNSDIFLQNATVQGGILANGAAAAIAIQGGESATLDGSSSSVTNTGLVAIQNQATLTLLGTITNDGTIALGSTNQTTELVMGGPTVTLTGSGAVTLSNNPANYIFGATAADTLDNVNNTISGAGDFGDTQLTLINAVGGTIDANQSNTLTLNTSGETVSNAGLLESTSSGGLLIQNTRVLNTGTVLANGGNVYLAGGTLAGGRLNASAGGAIVVTGGNIGTLDGSSAAVTVAGAVDINNQATLTLLGTIDNTSTIALQSTNQNTELLIGPASGTAGTVTLFDNGTITLSDNPANYIFGSEAGDKLVNAKNVIAGAGQLGDGQLTLVNDNIIDATGGNGLVVNTGGVTAVNDGLMEGTNPSGGLVIQTAVDSSGGGTILANGGNVYLQGGTLLGGTLNSSGASINVQSGYTGGLVGTTHAVTNLGAVTLSNQGTLDISGSIINDGSIALQSTNQSTDLVVNSSAATLTGGGTVTLSDNGANRIYGATGSDVLDNVNDTIVGAGQLGAAQLTLINAGIIDASGGNSLVLNTIAATNTGLMESSGPGGLSILTAVSNKGGTILAAAGNVYLAGGTVSGGTLNSGTASINVQGGLTGGLVGTASAVTNLGNVTLSNQGTLDISGSIINDGSIALQSINQNTDLVVNSSAATLTGGGTVTLSDNGANRIYGASGSDVLDNVNNTIVGAGQLGAGQLTLTNTGTIDALGGNALVLNTGGIAATNTGLMEATGSGGLVIETTVNGNGGSIVAAGGNVYLQGGTISAGTLNSSGGAAVVVQGGETGTLNGSTHPVTNLGSIAVNNQGTISVLGSLVNSGTLALQSSNQNTDFIVDTSKVTLSGGGTVTLTDNGANRIYGAATADELDNVNNTIEGSGQLGAGQLTLLDAGTIEATGGNALVVSLGSTGVVSATGQLLGIGSGGLSVQNGTYTNDGLIQADDGSSVSFSNGATLTNAHVTTTRGVTSDELLAGTYAAVAVSNGATVSVNAAAVTTDGADLILSGAGSAIVFDGTAIENSLTGITAAGTLQVLSDRSYTTTLALLNSGQLDLGGGVLTAKSLSDQAGSTLSGFGTVATGLVSAGSLVATGGVLDLKGATSISGTVSGTGTLAFDGAKSTLNSGTVLDVSTIAVINNASLVLNTPLSFAGTLDLVGPAIVSGDGFTNNGLLEQAGTGAAAAISASVTNAGSILIGAGGAISFTGGLANSGSITDNGTFKDTAALTGGSLTIGARGAAATIASGTGAGNSTLSTLTVGGGSLNTSGTTLTVTGDYNNTAANTGNSYNPDAGITGTIDGQGTQLAVVGVDGTTISSVNGTLTIAIAPGGSANFEIENTGASGSAALRGALQTTVNGAHPSSHLSGSGVTAQNFGPIAAGGASGVYTIDYSSGSLTGVAIHLASDFANVAGLTIDIVAATPATVHAAAGSPVDTRSWSPELFTAHHG